MLIRFAGASHPLGLESRFRTQSLFYLVMQYTFLGSKNTSYSGRTDHLILQLRVLSVHISDLQIERRVRD